MSGREAAVLKARLAAQTASAEGMVQALDGRINAHRVARYEFLRGLGAVDLFVRKGSRAEVRVAEEAFRRAGVMLAEEDRAQLGPTLRDIVATAEDLVSSFGAANREAGAGAAPTEMDDDRATLAGATAPSGVVPGVMANGEIAVRGDEIDTISRVMRGISRGLKRWTWEERDPGSTRGGTCWRIDNEIHVQNLLWLALSPVVSGLNYETHLPRVGAVEPRADFALPELGLLIEVKFIRRPSGFAQATAEIAADSVLYTSAKTTPYSRLIAFVWDDTRSTERHATFVEGLMAMPAVVDAVVVSRPASLASPGVGAD